MNSNILIKISNELKIKYWKKQRRGILKNYTAELAKNPVICNLITCQMERVDTQINKLAMHI